MKTSSLLLGLMLAAAPLGLRAQEHAPATVPQALDSAAVECLAPDHPEILAIHFTLGVESGPQIPPWIFRNAVEVPNQCDVFGSSA